jgi:anti-sigma-K factor RskA
VSTNLCMNYVKLVDSKARESISIVCNWPKSVQIRSTSTMSISFWTEDEYVLTTLKTLSRRAYVGQLMFTKFPHTFASVSRWWWRTYILTILLSYQNVDVSMFKYDAIDWSRIFHVLFTATHSTPAHKWHSDHSYCRHVAMESQNVATVQLVPTR